MPQCDFGYKRKAEPGYFCCVRELGHIGSHVDHEGFKFEGFNLRETHGKAKGAPDIYFGSLATELSK